MIFGTRPASQGIPEGAIDPTPERALMLEAGLDQLGAVDFEKGCYVGQSYSPHPLSWAGETPTCAHHNKRRATHRE